MVVIILSYLLAKRIAGGSYFLREILILSIYGLVLELISPIPEEGTDWKGKLMDQFVVAVIVVFTAVVATNVRYWVEGTFWDFTIVSLIGWVVLLSRLYVDLQPPTRSTTRGRIGDTSGSGFEKGDKAVYIAAILAITTPYILRWLQPPILYNLPYYPTSVALFVSIFSPALLFTSEVKSLLE
jgi:hypothetical protein